MMTALSPSCRLHDAPWLTLADDQILNRFCLHTGIRRNAVQAELLQQVALAFGCVPYENLTKIVKAHGVISAASAMRYPDEVLAEFLKFGAGGTCFALTAAAVAVFDALGIEAHPILADRHYGVNTHCGLIITTPAGMLLFDPGYLLCTPVAVPHHERVVIETGFNQIELNPIDNGARVELITVVKNNRKLRLTFKIAPVSDEAFGKAWEQSFAFEMMTYPVLTRTHNGCHHYLQGAQLAQRNSVRTQRTMLTRAAQIEYITTTFGIKRDLVIRALEIVNYGTNASALSR